MFWGLESTHISTRFAIGTVREPIIPARVATVNCLAFCEAALQITAFKPILVVIGVSRPNITIMKTAPGVTALRTNSWHNPPLSRILEP